MLTLIFGLFIFGLALIFLEVLFMEGLLGLLGGLAFVAAWTLVFLGYGAHWGLLSIVAGVFAVILMVTIEFKVASRTRWGQRFFHRSAIDSTSQAVPGTSELVGKEGETLTTLSPTGVIVVENRRYEAFSISGRLDRGTRVQVTDFDNFRVKVKAV